MPGLYLEEIGHLFCFFKYKKISFNNSRYNRVDLNGIK